MRSILTTLSLLLVFLCSHAQGKTLKEMQAISSRVVRHQMRKDVEPEMFKVGRRLSNVTIMKAPGKGFVVISNRIGQDEVLGYSDTEYKDDNVPCGFKCWLEKVNQSAGEEAAMPTPESSGNDLPDSVEPLIKSRWGQWSPYNDLCPVFTDDEGNEKRCPTGCVATAMAQIMYYYRWPETNGEGQDSITVVINTKGQKETLSMDFEHVSFDWDHMQDTYDWGYIGERLWKSYDERQATAVAELMLACGISAGMNYGPEESSAKSNTPLLLSKNFTYSLSWGISQNLLKQELADGYPILCEGYVKGEGHAFILDGYDRNGLFHYNFGWEGYCDGYYKMDKDILVSQYNGQEEGSLYVSSRLAHIRPGNFIWPERQIHVDMPGTLADLLTEGERWRTGYLTVSGDLNNLDLYHLRDIRLIQIDLSDAHLKASGDRYDRVFIQEDDVLPYDAFGSPYFESIYLGAETIILPTTLKRIDHSFVNNISLKCIHIPASVEEIHEWAFTGASNLKSIYCYHQTPIPITRDMFPEEVYQKATLYVPQGCLKNYYIRKYYWYRFKNIVEFDPTDLEEITPEGNTTERHAYDAIYDLTGRRLTGKPDKGIYIQNGVKRLAK